ncbi:MAG: thiamine-binding protein [Anaerolineae bacterium]
MVSAQVSLYPLRQPSIGPAIREAVRTLREQGLRVQMGPMSTLVWGEEKVVSPCGRRSAGLRRREIS